MTRAMHGNQHSQHPRKHTIVIQKVISPEGSKLNHSVINQTQGDQIRLSLEKRLEKKLIHPTHHTSRWIVL